MVFISCEVVKPLIGTIYTYFIEKKTLYLTLPFFNYNFCSSLCTYIAVAVMIFKKYKVNKFKLRKKNVFFTYPAYLKTHIGVNFQRIT